MENIDLGDEETDTSDSELDSYIDVTYPIIQLDSSRCHPLCSVRSLDQLRNLPVSSSFNVPSQQSFAFSGTVGTQILSKFSYWEVEVKLHLETHCEGPLCEIGVTSEKAMEANSVTVTPSCEKALTVHFYRSGQRLKAKTLYMNATISDIDICSFKLKRLLSRSVGFLFDAYDGRLSAINVWTQTVLCDVKLGRKEHLYPVLVIPPPSDAAEICLIVMKPEHLFETSTTHVKQIVELWIKNDDLAMEEALEDPSPAECSVSMGEDPSTKPDLGECLNDT